MSTMDRFNLHPGAAFGRLSGAWKLILALALGALIFTAAGGAWQGVKGWRSARKVQKLESDIAAKEKEIADIKAERAKDVERANAAEARALFAESKEAATQQKIDALGGRIAQEERKLDNAIQEAKRDAGACGAISDPIQRDQCLCSKLRDNGFAPPPGCPVP